MESGRDRAWPHEMSTGKPTKLVRNLLLEAFQTEQSAKSHCAREAKRLGTTPPGTAMRAASEHASGTLGKLDAFAKARGLEGHSQGRTLGRMLSMIRELSTDLFLSEEKSYRGTLMGMQHGKGVFLFLEDTAIANGDQELADLCHTWLERRVPILADAEQDLAWFAENPEIAATRAALLAAPH